MGMEITGTDTGLLTVPQRMPFHFGNVAQDDVAFSGDVGRRLVLELETEIDGDPATGLAMGGLGGTWFLKGSEIPLSNGTEAVIDVFDHSFDLAVGLAATTPFELWTKVHRQVAEWAIGTPYPRLLWTYGVSMVEQAIVDAYCQHREVSFADAVRSNELGLRLSYFHGELDGASAGELLPERPSRTMRVRHTVGQTDPLDESEALEGLNDGLPQTLADYVGMHGIDHLKVKLSADVEVDATRLQRIATVLRDCGLEEYVITLDANEAYESAADFKTQWTELSSDPAVTSLIERVQYVEQPLPRAIALDSETTRVFEAWEERPPLIVDESDDAFDSLPRALDSGYVGTSHKNCKGVFKGIANTCLLERYRERNPDREYVLSGEDLSTIGPIQLEQDLAVMGTLGIGHVERNGHHYYRGLDTMPASVQATALDAHSDLYRRHENGYPTLAITDGRLSLDSVVDAPFGRTVALDVDQLPAIQRSQ